MNGSGTWCELVGGNRVCVLGEGGGLMWRLELCREGGRRGTELLIICEKRIIVQECSCKNMIMYFINSGSFNACLALFTFYALIISLGAS